MGRRYAQHTEVPVAKSRGEISSLLVQFGCNGISWTDKFDKPRSAIVSFVFPYDGMNLAARFRMDLADGGDGRREHRVLLLWLKGALVAVEEGLVSPVEVFLANLVRRDGETVYQSLQDNVVGFLQCDPGRMIEGDTEHNAEADRG